MQIIEHEESFEVRDDSGKPVKYFYFEDRPDRRAYSGRMTKKQAEQAAKAFAGKA